MTKRDLVEKYTSLAKENARIAELYYQSGDWTTATAHGAIVKILDMMIEDVKQL